MKKKEFYGNLPRHERGPNTGRLNRKLVCQEYDISVQELFKAYWNWQEIFRIEKSTLTFEEYLNKQRSINIKPSQVGNGEGQYNLSRYKDEGPYTKESCRFILRIENIYEQENLFGKGA